MVVQATLSLFGSFFVMLLAGVPISAGIGIASVITALFSMPADIFALIAAQRCFSGLDSFSLLALPFFTLGGNIMNKGGIARRLIRLARLLVGKIPGYLAATNVHVLRRGLRLVGRRHLGHGLHPEPAGSRRGL